MLALKLYLLARRCVNCHKKRASNTPKWVLRLGSFLTARHTPSNHRSNMNLFGKVAVITGAGRGIGRAVALSLAKQNAKVALLSRTLSEVQVVAKEIQELGGEAHALCCDVADAASITSAFSDIKSSLGVVDIFVASAGIAPSASFLRTDLTLWESTLRVNLTGAFLCAQAVTPGMLQRKWGRIIFIASTAANKGYAYTSAYCASKHGLLGLTRAMAIELAESGVTINAICPGFVDTPMTSNNIDRIVQKTGRSPEEARKALEALSPQKRLVTPEEIAHIAVSLCDELSKGITGQGIVIAGGEVMS
jgi:NAD(P)-dependent dehydrogenase (short-subunit alcohol dehydrogenase family)